MHLVYFRPLTLLLATPSSQYTSCEFSLIVLHLIIHLPQHAFLHTLLVHCPNHKHFLEVIISCLIFALLLALTQKFSPCLYPSVLTLTNPALAAGIVTFSPAHNFLCVTSGEWEWGACHNTQPVTGAWWLVGGGWW